LPEPRAPSPGPSSPPMPGRASQPRPSWTRSPRLPPAGWA